MHCVLGMCRVPCISRCFECSLWMKNRTSFNKATCLWILQSVYIFRRHTVYSSAAYYSISLFFNHQDLMFFSAVCKWNRTKMQCIPGSWQVGHIPEIRTSIGAVLARLQTDDPRTILLFRKSGRIIRGTTVYSQAFYPVLLFSKLNNTFWILWSRKGFRRWWK